MWPGSLPGEQRRVRCRDLHRNVGTGVARADHQHAPVAQLRRVPVVPRVQLDDPRIEVGRERRDLGLLVVPHRDHDVVGGEDVIAGRDLIAVPAARQPVDAHAVAEREIEVGRVRLEIVGHLVLGDERGARRRERHAGQAVETGRGEQEQ